MTIGEQNGLTLIQKAHAFCPGYPCRWRRRSAPAPSGPRKKNTKMKLIKKKWINFFLLLVIVLKKEKIRNNSIKGI
jgi:hypothetical protein